MYILNFAVQYKFSKLSYTYFYTQKPIIHNNFFLGGKLS